MRGLILYCLTLLAVVEANLFGGKTGVRELSASNFKNEVLYDGNVSLVAFYAPWCGYCQKLSPELKAAAKSLKGIAKVNAVNCDASHNQALCQKYKVKGYPTVKVFQPAKLTDVDFKDALEGNTLPRRKPKMFSYNGERTAGALTSFTIGKLRNYAATLSTDDALRWMAPNLVPRVLMLPGKKYKSKSVSPLFKVLSREYFGKMRFAMIPRRVDGAWNLLGLKAPDESQLVYMSDDQQPVMYKGSMKKKAIKAFLEEQYVLEMQRRKHKGGSQAPSRDDAANGLEYVEEDAQPEELEHVVRRKQRALEELDELKQAKIEAYKRAGVEYTEEDMTTEPVTTSISTSAPLSTPSGDIEDEGIEAEDFESESTDGAEEETQDRTEEQTEDDGYEDAALDEAIADISPDQMVNEGPEAIASYMEILRSAQNPTGTKPAAAANEKASTTVSAPAATSAKSSAGITSYDMFVERCLRTGYHCAVAVVKNETFRSDLSTLVRALERIPKSVKQKTLFEFIVADQYPDLDEFLGVIDFDQRPSLFFWDAGRQKIATLSESWTVKGLADFATKAFHRKVDFTIKLPPKYLYWITNAEVEAQLKSKQQNEEEDIVKDEL